MPAGGHKVGSDTGGLSSVILFGQVEFNLALAEVAGRINEFGESRARCAVSSSGSTSTWDRKSRLGLGCWDADGIHKLLSDRGRRSTGCTSCRSPVSGTADVSDGNRNTWPDTGPKTQSWLGRG